ncbi:MAG TPA: hypothetical protein VFN78_00780 [Ktedonobacterales bacterium]|nr:hypothetical protein [Ktedonobacterales bacterium]
MTIERIAASIKQQGEKTKPVLIGIEGYGGAGKTTFAQKLAAALGDAFVVSLDDFIVKEKLAEPSWDSGAFDRERLARQVLRPAHDGQPIAYQRLDWGTDTLSDPVIVPEVAYLIVEGISAYHPSLERYYDVKIWVETPLAIAEARGHARDGGSENAAFWELWAQNDIAYQQQYHPEARADVVYVNG